MDTQEAWKIQAENIDRYSKENPGLVTRSTKKSEKEIFDEIGVWNLPPNRPYGYFRFAPEDFIVEEKIDESKISKVSDISVKTDLEKPEDLNTLYANLIKIGIPTAVAIERIAKALDFPQSRIGFAGLKDSDAITAQLISFPGIKDSVAEICATKIPNVHLTNFYYDKGSLNPGSLEANIFTITIRTRENIDELAFRSRVDTIGKYGVLNYFQWQRFGGLRLLSHRLGKLLMQGEFEETIKMFLFTNSSMDIPLLASLRDQAKPEWGNWQGIRDIYMELPYILFNEIRLLDFLIDNPDNYVGALIHLKDQTLLWFYAYSSWLFNKHLSEYSLQNGCVAEKFPVASSPDRKAREIYQKYFQEDNIGDFEKTLYPFKFIRPKNQLIAGRMFAQNIKYSFFEKGVVIKFGLPKASYATTFLANLFELELGMPVPDWVNGAEIDPLALIGNGSVKGIKEIFKEEYYTKVNNSSE